MKTITEIGLDKCMELTEQRTVLESDLVKLFSLTEDTLFDLAMKYDSHCV